MPESPSDETLQRILTYPAETPSGADADSFVVGVMARVRRIQRRRRLILFTFGGIGALFGAAGAFLLADPLGRLFTDGLSAVHVMQAALLAGGAAAFYVWVMGDDLALTR